jgi:hypothetical protein
MRLTLVLIALSGALLLVPATAGAKSWQGKTAQHRPVSVRTGTAGLVNRVRISWRSKCQNGHYKSTTLFRPPFDTASKTAFVDEGTYHAKIPGTGNLRARHTAFVSATLDDKGVWRGTFRVKTRVTRKGKFVDSCRVKGVHWSAKPAE